MIAKKMSIQEKIDYFNGLNEASFYNELMGKPLWKIQQPGLLRHNVYEHAADAKRGLSEKESRIYQRAGTLQLRRFNKLLLGRVLSDGSPESRFLFEPFAKGQSADIKGFRENGGGREKGIELLAAVNAFMWRFDKHAKTVYSQEEEKEGRLKRQFVPTEEIVSKHVPTFVPAWATLPANLIGLTEVAKAALEKMRGS